MKYFLTAFFAVCCFSLAFSQESELRTFQLKNGDKVAGTVLKETDSSFVVQTSIGELTILKSNIKPREITVYLKDGNRISGEVLSQTNEQMVLRTSFGSIALAIENIERTAEQGVVIPGTQGKEEFNYSQSRLIDIFFDPTGYTLEKGSIYLSGLSWGVGLTDNIDISSSYWRYFFADLNIRPKIKIYSSGNIEADKALSVGFHLHAGGQTGKWDFKKDSTVITDWSGTTLGYRKNNEWNEVGKYGDMFMWGEIFTGYTMSFLKGDKRGRIAYHIGASAVIHKSETYPRAWIAVENDVTEKFKILGQIYYDPFQPSYRERINNEKRKNPFDVDLGFVYAYSKNFRIGIHYQPYIILFYYEF